MYEELVRKARDLKRRSRKLRDEGDYVNAERLLRDAIEQMRDAGKAIRDTAPSGIPASQDYRDLARELADCWGSLGGIQRRQAEALDADSAAAEKQTRLDAALEAYEEGLTFEQDDRFRVANSYNLVQSVVLPVIRKPGLLTDASFKDKLRKVHDSIERQIATVRSDDPWAYSDLGLVELLGGDPSAAHESWDQMDALQPERNVYVSGLPVLQSLSAALTQVDPERRAESRFSARLESA